MTKVSLSQMQHLNALERQLSKKEVVSQNLDFVETGSPLDIEIKRMQALHGKDLDGLPPGHPLLRILAEAKQRYEARQNAIQQQQSQMPTATVTIKTKSAKPQPSGKRVATSHAGQEEAEAKRVVAAHKVNRAIEQTDDALRKLMKEIIDNEALINTEHVGKIRLYRLKRTADAMRRLLGESKIPGARA